MYLVLIIKISFLTVSIENRVKVLTFVVAFDRTGVSGSHLRIGSIPETALPLLGSRAELQVP